MITIGHFINGLSVAHEGRTQDVYNPATGIADKKVLLASKKTVQEAINAAQAAFPAWRNTPVIKRARVMFKFKQLLEDNADHIAQLIVKLVMTPQANYSVVLKTSSLLAVHHNC
jgi:malonate-semialdehyde dehydrogenase (acetylating)/methylmalonate-semialdehyde dehydrogenase